MSNYDDVQATHKRVLDLLCNPMAGEHGDGTDVSAETMKDALAAMLLDGRISINIMALREVDANGDVGAITANGGVLASDTTPVLAAAATTEHQEITWAASNNDGVSTTLALPPDFDGSQDVTLNLRHKSGGTTNDASFTVETSWDGGTQITDTSTTNATTSYVNGTATIAAADVPDAPRYLTLTLRPVAHTTDTTVLMGLSLDYKKKLS